MTVSLERFDYTFGVDGRIGGLKKLVIDLAEEGVHGNESDAEPARVAMREGSGLHKELDSYLAVLDELFAEDFLDGRRVSWWGEGEGSVRVGYDYDGRWVPKKRRPREAEMATRLAEICGVPDPDMRGGQSARVNLGATVTLRGPRLAKARPDGRAFANQCATVWLELDHALSTCVFRFTQALQGVEVQEQAAKEMAALDERLATDWDSPGRDHCREYMQAWAENFAKGDATVSMSTGPEAMA